MEKGIIFKRLKEIKTLETMTLGISWNPRNDCFIFRVKVELSNSYTKWQVLSTITRIFYPLWLLGLVIDKAKILIQILCRIIMDWNDESPESEFYEWHQFLISLKSVNNIKIGKHILIEKPEIGEIHSFTATSKCC